MDDAVLRGDIPWLEDKDALHDKDRQFFHPWDRPNLMDENARTIMVGGRDATVTDIDGHDLIDGPGGMWCLNLGHGADEIADAMAEQARALAYSDTLGHRQSAVSGGFGEARRAGTGRPQPGHADHRRLDRQ